MFQKGKTRKGTKKRAEIRKRSYYIRLGVFVFLYALVLVNIFTRYDDEIAQNTVELKGSISNVVYDANQGQPWVNFTLQDQQFFYVLRGTLRPVEDHQAFFQQLEDDQISLTIRYTKEKEWVNFFHHIGRNEVVQIEDNQTGEVYYPVSHRNARERIMALIYFVEATIVWIVMGFIYFTDTFLQIITWILPSKKKQRSSSSKKDKQRDA